MRDDLALGVVIDGPPGFVQGLLSDWRRRYRVSVFSHRDLRLPVLEGRINRRRLERGLARFLAANQVVFFEWAGPLLVVGSRLRPAAPIVVRLHSFELFEYAPQVNWDAVSHVVLVSQAMQRQFCELYPAHAPKTSVVHNGIDLASFAAPRREFGCRLGTLCNLLPIKRVYELVLMAHQLAQSGVDFTLRIGGPRVRGLESDRYYAAVQRLTGKLSLRDRVSFLGQVEDPAAFLKTVDVFISNSYWEGQQVALLEAMAAGCYCLAHAWDGAEEVLPPEHLFLTDDELREKIRSFLALDGDVRRAEHDRMATAAHRFAAADTHERIRGTLEAVASSAGGRRRPRGRALQEGGTAR